MSKNVLFLFALLAGMTVAQQKSGINTQVPPEVTQSVVDALKGNQGGAFYDFDHWKNKGGLGFESATKLSDIKPGNPVRLYWLVRDTLTKSAKTVRVSSLVTQLTDEWDVPLLLNGKIVSFCEVVRNKTSGDQWQVAGLGNKTLAKEWQKVITKWPRSAGFNPVFIETGSRRFFHIPEISDTNLTYLRVVHHKNDPLEEATDSTYSSLMSTNVLLGHPKSPTVPSCNTEGTKR
jgi:hypothetical protein